MSDHHAEGVEAHTGSAEYIRIAVVLFALTAMEVLLYEACFGHLKADMPGLAASLGPYFVELLLLLSAFKFWLVAMFYMHLKFDLKVLQWLFGFSLVLAAIIIMALFTLFAYNRTLWWGPGAGIGTPW
jgi:hypothetical protein